MSYLSDFHTKSALEASSSCSFSTFFLCGAHDEREERVDVL
jgi:hypothetical protein